MVLCIRHLRAYNARMDEELYWFFQTPVGVCLLLAVLSGVVWLPVVFIAYAVGRRQVSLRLLLIAITCEAILLGLSVWLIGIAFTFRAP